MPRRARPLPWKPLAKAVSPLIKQAPSLVGALGPMGLDWTVAKEPVHLASRMPGQLGKRIARHRAVVRSDTGDPLGVVGRRYQPIQNRRMMEFIDHFCADPSVKAQTMTVGEWDGGRRVYVVLRLSRWDKEPWPSAHPFRVHMVLANAHDGTAAFRVGVVPIHRTLGHQMRLMLSGRDPGIWSIRHLRHIASHVADSLQTVGRYLGEFERARVSLLAAPITGQEASDLVARLIPVPEAAPSRMESLRLGYRDGILAAYDALPDESLKGTRWGLLSAVAEWEQFHRPMHAPQGTDRVDWLFGSLLKGRGNEYCNRAFRLLSR